MGLLFFLVLLFYGHFLKGIINSETRFKDAYRMVPRELTHASRTHQKLVCAWLIC